VSEPKIIINGTELTKGQAMTIRVALENMSMDLHENEFGDDNIKDLYLKNIRSIRELILK